MTDKYMDNTSEAKRKKMMRRKRAVLKRTHRRINVAFIIVFVLLLALGIRIFMINYTHGEEYSQAVLNHQTYTSTTIPYMRGNITASDGTVLAYSEKVYNLILDVKSVTSEDGKYLDSTINALVKCFGLDKDNVKKIINDNPTSQYQKLLKELTSDEIAEFNELKSDKSNNINGVWFEESYVRKYPFSTLACDIIGFASNVNGGELGLESQYDDELTGTDGVTYSYVDEDLNAVETTKAAVNGNNIVTDYDYYIALDSFKSDADSVVIGPKGDSAATRISKNSSEREKVTITFSGKDGKYTVSYAIGDTVYPATNYESGVEFTPGSMLSLLVVGTDRDPEGEDINGADATIINNTDMKLYVKIVDDDENPRFKIREKSGEVVVYE